MQKFSYHTHTNSFGLFDGSNSAEEMISKAKQIGYTKLGISNHLIFHPNMPNQSQMFFSDFESACDIYKRVIEEIKTVSLKLNFETKVGFEVDFFPSVQWRNQFEAIKSKINADYYIGATHFLRDKKEKYLMNFYYLRKHQEITINDKDLTLYLNNYWDNVIESIKSGYFNFIAHIDVCKIFNYCIDNKWDERKWETIEALDKYKQPYEINTSGWSKIGEQHPHTWMIEESAKRNIPVIVSDDAHSTEMLAQHFDKAEKILETINYKNRYCPKF